MKKILIISSITLTILFWSGCKEEGRLDHIDDSAPAPAAVTIVEVKNKPGGAVIKYTVPNDEKLLGVKVVFERKGEICETKASLYVDSLTVEGFGDTNSREVKLYSVGKNGKLSEPVMVSITPLNPPVFSVQADMNASFGGVVINLSNNLSNADLALVLMADTVGDGEWIPIQTFYTKATSRRFSCRGLAPQEGMFALYIRDRWNNKSDTLVKILTPIEEIELPRISFTNAQFPGDSYDPAENNYGYRLENVWDGKYGYSNFYAGQFSAPMPQHFTINLGRKMSISRFQLFPRFNELYAGSFPRTFEIWGTDNPDPDGGFDNWYLLGQWSQLKPSGYGDGSSSGTITDEDRIYFQSGGDYELESSDKVPDPYITISYLRFRTTSTFTTYGSEATSGQVIIGELTLYGQLKDNK